MEVLVMDEFALSVETGLLADLDQAVAACARSRPARDEGAVDTLPRSVHQGVWVGTLSVMHE